MSVSGIPDGVSLPSSGAQVERAVLVLRKQQDVAQSQAQGLIQLVQQAAPTADQIGRHVSLYA